MLRRNFINTLPKLGLFSLWPVETVLNDEENLENSIKNDRKYWYRLLNKIAYPVFSNLAHETLVKNMPVEKSPTYDERKNVTYLEAVGRTAAGIAPWLSLPEDFTGEGLVRKKLKELFLQGITNGVNPHSPDFLNFEKEKQPIIDAGHLAQAFLRAPKALWEPLDNVTKSRVVNCFKMLRTRKPHKNNWLIFHALTECFLLSIGEVDWQKAKVESAIKKFEEWYVGDGWYSDGVKFSFNYYNSFAMHPMMIETLEILLANDLIAKERLEIAFQRMVRHAEQLERMISPVGTFPPIGRSITYRTGVFHALSMLSLREKLPKNIAPAQVRSALTLVKKNLLIKDVFDKNDWLKLGFKGTQPEVADYYTSTGSLYMTTLSFLPLGLPADNEFWTAESEAWTSKKAWNGQSFDKDFQVQY